MRRFGLWILCFGLCGPLFLVGCGKGSWPMSKGTSGGVAVVDLNVVASRLGRTDEMRDLAKQKSDVLTEEWMKAKHNGELSVQLKMKKFEDPPTEEQQKEKQELEGKIQAELAQKRQEFQNELKVYESSLLTRFRDDVKVVARKIALEKGLSIVVTKSDLFLISVEPEYEITDAVIEKMRANLAPMVASAQPPKAERTPAADKSDDKEDRTPVSPSAPSKPKSKKRAPAPE